MEKTSALNTTELAANSSATTGLPELAVIFAPVLLMQLLVGLVSNLLLIALLVKASSVKGQNNINIYLYSVAISNLLSLFPALTLLISTVTKEWVLGQTICSLNQFVTSAVSMLHLVLNMCISRERYGAVVHFSEWKLYSRRTYIYVAMVWITAIFTSVSAVVQVGHIVGTTDPDVFSCYTPNGWIEERRLLPLVVLYLLIVWISNLASLAFCTAHYAYTFKALYIIKKMRVRTEPVMLYHMDIPISLEAEVRTLKSMACVFFVSMPVPFIPGTVYFTVVAAIAISEGKPFREVDVPLLHVAMAVCAYLIPTRKTANDNYNQHLKAKALRDTYNANIEKAEKECMEG
ncbi:hypothetical protein EMCRGX_G031604 [Ephydatia muelleri]